MIDVLKLRLGDTIKVKTRFGVGLLVGVRATEQLVGYPLSDELFIYYKDGIKVDNIVKTKFYWFNAEDCTLVTKLLTDEEKRKHYEKSESSAKVVNARPDAQPEPKLKDKAQQVLF